MFQQNLALHGSMNPGGDAIPGDWVNLANNWAHMAAYNLTGWPTVAVPAGVSDGLPFGLQVVAQP
jgi:Asp-tRNA(Asn)/Glu-tRNA(Gln) amidotransferase A subunit family amidase